MKHLKRCLQSKPLSGPVIPSVFDQSQPLIGGNFHTPLLEQELPQQTIEVLVAAAQPTEKQIGKSGPDAKRLIDGLVIRKRP